MDRYEVENVVDRVKKIYRSSTPSEQKVLRDILQEISMYGQSETYEEIWLSDYKEIPVDIHTFVCDDYYLGKTNDNGKRVYPFWHKTMEEIFKVSNKYEECFFTGATRIGKSSTAITCTAYMLYKLMCLKDPQKFFNKKDISKFSILFFNITKELASGVGYREFQDTILASPWFMSHGARKGSDMNPYYVPEGGKVIINYGSDAAHSLGQQVFVGFCVKGDTLVSTEYGYQRIDSLVDRTCKFLQYGDNNFTFSEGTVRLTKYVDRTIRLETTSGAYVEGTEDHPIMVSGGEYKELSKVLLSDKLVIIIKNKLKHESIKRIGITHHKKPVPVYDVVECKPHHNFITKGGLILHNCDEMNFARTGVKDVSKAKEHMMDLYNTVTDRVKGTFRMEGEVYGKVFAVSSKKSDSDFMESYMQNQIAAGAGDHMYISDAPQWEVLPPSMFHKETFYIAVGDRHKRGFVVSDQVAKDKESLDSLKDQGYTLLTPPVDMKSQFIADFDIALRDLAGISVPGALSYITQDQISKCIGNRKNPFHQEILEIGTDDNYTIEEFFDMDKVDKRYLSMYHYIHLDLSLNADKTGISDVCISGRKNVKDKDGKTISMPTFTHMFSIAIQAPRGANIAYDKITTFIIWLRKQGFNIRGISRDQFQSEYMGQLLESKGFGKVGKISLDRTPDGYMAFRSILSEGRIDLLDIELLQTELINLQRDSFSGRVDHPIGGSKDTADSLAGAVWNATLSNPQGSAKPTTVSGAIASVNRKSSRPEKSLPSMFPNINSYKR